MMTGQIPRSDDLATVIIVSPSDDRQHLIVCHAHIARPVACSESQKGSPYTNPLLIKFKCRIHVVHSRGRETGAVTTQCVCFAFCPGHDSGSRGWQKSGHFIPLRGMGNAFVERIKRVWWQQNCSFCSSVWGQIFT